MSRPLVAGEGHPELQAAGVLAVLERPGVEYVLIVGFAAQLHGAQ